MLLSPKQIRIEDFDFELPDSAIARFPLAQRELSKLLVYENGAIEDSIFLDISDKLNPDDLIILNDTRVIPARLFFKKATGGEIEILCLEPIGLSHQDAMSSRHQLNWLCMVGGAKKWRNDEVLCMHLQIEGLELRFYAKKISQADQQFQIEFSWTHPEFVFSEILLKAGEIPLPPYFKREVEPSDVIRYQTVFASAEGSVAAPTAGLHFTPELLKDLENKGIENHKLTLHVGAGTFKPVSTETIADHPMHGEVFSVGIELLELLASQHNKRIIAVGTTCVRTLESLYWIGVKLKINSFSEGEIPFLNQWEAYELTTTFTLKESLEAIIHFCRERNHTHFRASTSILIAPGFQFRICKGMFTNFHLPKSTLLLLVSAFIGEDWKKIYRHALTNHYRFLSYGDSSLLLP